MAFDSTPRRVVCLQPSATVILASIGRLDRVVACTKYCVDVCPEVKDRGCAIVSDSWTAETAQISAVKPDLVIAAVPYQENAVSAILKSGARFLGLAPNTLADVYLDIAAIAGIMGVPESGQAVIVDMEKQIEAVRARSKPKKRPTIFCEEWGKPIIASQSWVTELAAAAGGVPVGIPGAKTTSEAVLALDPEIFIAAWCGAGDRVPLEKIVRERGWEQMRAAKSGRVFCVRDEYLNTPAPTLIRGLQALAAAISPGQFPRPDGLRSINVN